MLRVVKLIVYLLGSGVLLQITSGMSYAADKEVFGLHEHIHIAEFDVGLEAKLDTGALTSSLSATDIEEFEHDGDDWVRFRLAFDGAPKKTYELLISRTSKIKRRAGDFDPKISKTYTSRPVVELKLTMGSKTKMIEVSLTDRTRFKYPFLVGSKALRKFDAVVDPSIRFTTKKPHESEKKDSSDSKSSDSSKK